MTKAASMDVMQRIHRKLAEAIEEELDLITGTKDSELPAKLEPALLNAISKFLKDNDITADIKDSDDLAALKDKMTQIKAGSLVKDAASYDLLN